jgi:hypothetical protein
MTNVFYFVPKHELAAKENLSNFIAGCKHDLYIFGRDLDFDAMVWDVTNDCARKGQGAKKERITFCTLESAKANPVALSVDFGNFAKAYVRYMQGLRPVVGIGPRVAALRALEAALVESGSICPTSINAHVLNRAASFVAASFEKATAYRIGTYLEMIAKFLTDSRFVTTATAWRSPLKRPKEGTRVGRAFDEARVSKMPSDAALKALPKAFRLAIKPRHVIVTSTAAILCSAPDRINELTNLPVACEVSGQQNGNMKEAYGIRWWPSKGGEPMIKWVIPSMVDVVKEALSKIRTTTDEAREIALWYEQNPSRIFLRSEIAYLRSHAELSMTELSEVLWSDSVSRTSGRQWCVYNDVTCERKGRNVYAKFSDVEKAVVAMLPSNFPIYEKERKTKFSDALFVIPRNLMHSKKATYACMIEAVVIQHVNDGLGARSEYGADSVFDEFGFFDDQNERISVTTHQFRHYLNTLAQAGGLSQLDIAKWSGRIDISQNTAYDHVTTEEMLQKVKSAIGDKPLVGLPFIGSEKKLISRDEFHRIKIVTAHTTEFGFCIHDFTMAPCQLHRDCINCEEQVCIKGDQIKYDALQMQLGETRRFLSDATDAVSEGYMGSDRWVEHQTLTVNRLESLLNILDDPAVPSGSVIQLSNENVATRIADVDENFPKYLSRLVAEGDSVAEEPDFLLKKHEAEIIS